MEKIILEIKQTIEKKGLSESKAAKMAGLNQNKVNRMLSGTTKKIDMYAVEKLRSALGMVAEPLAGYAATAIHQSVSPDLAALLQKLDHDPELKQVALEVFLNTTEDQRAILLGRLQELKLVMQATRSN